MCFVKDFVLYIMAGLTHVFGRKPTMREREKDRERERKGKRPLKVDTFLSAPDLLARHLLVRRDSAVPETPTGQGTNSASSEVLGALILCSHTQVYNLYKAVFDVFDPQLISFYSSFDATLQGRCSYTQRNGPL